MIWVERDGQKAIVIGKDGETLKLIGSNARRDIERARGLGVLQTALGDGVSLVLAAADDEVRA